MRASTKAGQMAVKRAMKMGRSIDHYMVRSGAVNIGLTGWLIVRLKRGP